MGPALLSIDFGTTNTAAYLDGQGLVHEVRLSHTSTLMPSAVFADGTKEDNSCVEVPGHRQVRAVSGGLSLPSSDSVPTSCRYPATVVVLHRESDSAQLL